MSFFLQSAAAFAFAISAADFFDAASCRFILLRRQIRRYAPPIFYDIADADADAIAALRHTRQPAAIALFFFAASARYADTLRRYDADTPPLINDDNSHNSRHAAMILADSCC